MFKWSANYRTWAPYFLKIEALEKGRKIRNGTLSLKAETNAVRVEKFGQFSTWIIWEYPASAGLEMTFFFFPELKFAVGFCFVLFYFICSLLFNKKCLWAEETMWIHEPWVRGLKTYFKKLDVKWVKMAPAITWTGIKLQGLLICRLWGLGWLPGESAANFSCSIIANA